MSRLRAAIIAEPLNNLTEQTRSPGGHGQIAIGRRGPPVFIGHPVAHPLTIESDDALADDEIKCKACNGTGVQLIKQPSEPGKRIYAPRCKVCDGKGKLKKATG